MILKGSQRGHGDDLATHLMNALDNERVEIAEIYGAVADDLHGAFAEFAAVASGTRATKYLYSLSINPSAPLTREQYFEAIAAIEDRLGLTGQPRAIVFHVKPDKHGVPREHCHVVWSRIDIEKMRAIHMAHDHRRLCDLSCELAHKYGLDLPPGLKAWEKKQAFKKDRLEPTLAENAYTEKTGIDPEQRREDITATYEQSDSAAAFRAALEQKGYMLARGDRRGFVVVDKFGQVHSLSRYVKGHTAKQIKAKLAPLTPEQLPTADQAKEQMRQRSQAAKDAETDRLREQRRAALEKRFAENQVRRRAELAGVEQALLVRQASEKLALHAAQQRESKALLFRVRSAVADLIGRTPALRSILGHIQKLTHLDPKARHRLERETLARRHAREKIDIERKKRALAKIEAREQRALGRGRAQTRDQAQQIDPAKRHKGRQDFFEAARDQGLWRKRDPKEYELTVRFNDAAEFVEGADRVGGDDDDDRALSWKERAENNARRQRRQRSPRPRKGRSYRREE